MQKIIEKILSGTSDVNIKFSELRKFVISLGFNERIKGDYFIYFKSGIAEIIKFQHKKDGKAKPYQVKQVRNLILKYKLVKEQ